ncbi:DUF2989 domain-containing protein [Psychromonas sp. MME2]|uniref:DUF2989 domain-containing protein n=1 Tax=unclassified Psychromonas TaxID=2614957 RepID=UPI00339D0B11
MITQTIKFIFGLVTLFAIISCNPFSHDSLSRICDSDPELCADLHTLTDCRFQRTHLIRARYYDKREPSSDHTRQLLDRLDEYESCIELTLSLQFTRNQGRKQARVENYLTTKNLMKNELKKIKNTEDPILAYYLWTHYQDLKAKQVFLNAARKEGVTDRKLLTKLAIYYSKFDPQQALALFYNALRESNSYKDIPDSTFVYIMTIYYQAQDFEKAYIWALLAISKEAMKAQDEQQLEYINLDLILQKGLINGKKLITNEMALQEQANIYKKKLMEGKFSEYPETLIK